MLTRILNRIASVAGLLALTQLAAAQCQPTWHEPPAGATATQEPGNGIVYASCRWAPDSGVNTPTRAVIGGSFSITGGITTNHIASWDGTAWYAIGSGMNGNVYALATDGTTLYAGGQFTTAGGVACNNVARWTGSAWQPLLPSGGSTNGVNGAVFTMLVDQSGTLWVGGSFTTAGGGAASHIAAWDGFNWVALGSGVNGNVLSMCDNGTSGIYVGGSFTTAGGNPASHIAFFDNSWHPVGAGVSSDVNAIAIYNSQVYAGGVFASANGSSTFVGAFARYNGSTWSAISTPAGIGVSSTHVSPRVDSLLVFNNSLYIGGLFDTCAGLPTPGIARLDASGVHALGAGVTPATSDVFSMVIHENSVVAMGSFSNAGGLPVTDMARWNETEWSRLESQATGPVLAMLVLNGDLFAGGNFSFQAAPGSFARNVVSLTSSGVGVIQNAGGFTGTTGPVYTMCSVAPVVPQLPPSMVIAGQFASAGGVTVNNICAISSTSAYTPLGAGLNNTVDVVKQFNSVIYAAGVFSASGSTPLNKVARYVGGAWQPAGTTGLSGGFANAMEVYNGNLYMGGTFTGIDGISTGGIARWDGSAWHALMTNFPGSVYALTVYNGQLIIGGTFSAVANSTNICTWDGAAFHPLGVGLGALAGDQYVSALAVHNGELWAGGKFTFAQVPSNLMMWNGLNWNIEDTSMVNDGYIAALASSGGELWAGGFFFSSGGHFDPFIGRFFCTCYVNCDNSTTSPVLNANDFQCFLNQFAFGGDYANCDGSAVTPVLNANDFQCFLNKFATGCN